MLLFVKFSSSVLVVASPVHIFSVFKYFLAKLKFELELKLFLMYSTNLD